MAPHNWTGVGTSRPIVELCLSKWYGDEKDNMQCTIENVEAKTTKEGWEWKIYKLSGDSWRLVMKDDWWIGFVYHLFIKWNKRSISVRLLWFFILLTLFILETLYFLSVCLTKKNIVFFLVCIVLFRYTNIFFLFIYLFYFGLEWMICVTVAGLIIYLIMNNFVLFQVSNDSQLGYCRS